MFYVVLGGVRAVGQQRASALNNSNAIRGRGGSKGITPSPPASQQHGKK